MKQVVLIALALGILLTAVSILRRPGTSASTDPSLHAPGFSPTTPLPPSLDPNNQPPIPAPALSARPGTRLNDTIQLAHRLHDPESSVDEDLEHLQVILGSYHKIHGVYPVASLNEEVMAQLTGQNEKGVILFPPDHPALSDKGALLDRFGHPYFFHALSRNDMDIWSAGPDKIFGTSDDTKLHGQLPR